MRTLTVPAALLTPWLDAHNDDETAEPPDDEVAHLVLRRCPVRRLAKIPAAFVLMTLGMLATACDQTATSPDQVALEPPMLMEAGVLPPHLAAMRELDDEIEELLAGAAAGGHTVVLRDDATGGDCAPDHGTWDAVTKTCTLTSDVFDAIEFESPGLTLDCDGHQVNGEGSGFVGVFIFADNATVTECEITGFSFGVVPLRNDGHSITENSIHDILRCGIVLVRSDDNLIHDNSIHDILRDGIVLVRSDDNLIHDNSVAGNIREIGIVLLGTSSNNVIEENTVDIVNPGPSGGIFLGGFGDFPTGPFTGPSNNVIRNNKITASGEGFHVGIFPNFGANDNLVEGNDIVSSLLGIFLDVQANRNTFVSNTIRLSGSGIGINMATGGPGFPTQVGSDDNVFLDNVIRGGVNGFFIGTGEVFSPTAFRKIAKGNRVEGNKISMTTEAGIVVHSAEDTDVTRNVVQEAGTNSLLLIDSPMTAVWLNDFFPSEGTPVSSDAAAEISFNNIGNFWGRECDDDQALMIPGEDSNRPDVVDSHPFDEPIADEDPEDVEPPEPCEDD